MFTLLWKQKSCLFGCNLPIELHVTLLASLTANWRIYSRGSTHSYLLDAGYDKLDYN